MKACPLLDVQASSEVENFEVFFWIYVSVELERIHKRPTYREKVPQLLLNLNTHRKNTALDSFRAGDLKNTPGMHVNIVQQVLEFRLADSREGWSQAATHLASSSSNRR
jgi:hypothetical protein